MNIYQFLHTEWSKYVNWTITKNTDIMNEDMDYFYINLKFKVGRNFGMTLNW